MTPAFVHTPYDSGRPPFAIGLSPLDPAHWIDADDHLADELAQKEALIAGARDDVFREEAATRAAQSEVLDLLRDHLPARYPAIYQRRGGTLHIVPAARTIAVDTEEAPLLTAARLVQEDLCLMRRGPEGWRLAAACLCFPSGWSLAEKIGRDFDAIHAPVPGMAGRMAAMVARIFDNLRVEQQVERFNWSIYGDARLPHPETRSAPHERFPDAAPVLARAHIRVERQTLRRLPASGDILFTIRLYIDPLAALAGHSRRVELAGALRAQLAGMNAAELAYKGLSEARGRLDAALAGLETMIEG